MPKRKFKKLTDKLREKIRIDYDTLKLSGYQGEALSYLKQVKQLAKARKKKAKKKKDSKAVVGQLDIPKDSELYRIIEKGAKLKGMTVRQFMKKYAPEIEALAKDGDFISTRETEYLIRDLKHLKTGKKVYVNDGNGYMKVGPKKDILNITLFTQHVMSYTDIFKLFYRVHQKTTGDMSHFLPSHEEYEDLEEPEDVIEMLNGFYPEITYLISGKKDAPQKEEKIIAPQAKERKKTSNKGEPKQRSKRKSISKAIKKK